MKYDSELFISNPYIKSECLFSPDRLYRYWLIRIWDESLPVLTVIGVNPSTADETINDPTVRKVIGFAKRLNYGGLLMLNVGGYRSTDPVNWRKQQDPIGEENTAKHLLNYVKQFNTEKVIAAWGKNGNYQPKQCNDITNKFPELYCWGRNKDGTPKHPLMISYESKLEKFNI
jgi:hypothetical protein